MPEDLPKDRLGNIISVGDKIRVISVDRFLKGLPEEELEQVKSMLGEIFEVYEIDKYGSPWVEKWWYFKDGESQSHSLALLPEEMEKVSG